MPSATTTLHAAFDPDQFRTLGHKLVDRLAGYLSAATGGAKMPVLPSITAQQLERGWPARFLPGPGGRFEELVARMIAGSNHLHHPRFVGHQVASVLPVAALSELAVALLNNSLAVFEMGPSGTAIERSVVEWMTRTMGWDTRAGGILTSGGALGNLTAMLAARQAKAGEDVWNEGGAARYTMLVSEQAHYSIERAARVMGWGRHGAVLVPADDEHRMRRTALEESFGTARRAGLKVIGVVANAGSTPTGTYDPLPEIADFCAAYDLWLHVDAAHGAAAALSERYRPLLAGIDRADSVVWDAHKMLLMPLLVTGVLFRDRTTGERTFAQEASYLFAQAPESTQDLGRQTFECSKPVLGFGLYAALTLYGTDAFAAYVTGTFDLARRFAALIRGTRDFELAVEPQANIVCFRYSPAGRGGDLDALQARVRQKVMADGAYYLTQVRLTGGLFLRTTLINPFTSESDLAGLLEAARKAGK
ncbi:MAG: aminotransferase class I/II-fold pyridoxal phosphate-dependent enzyme [Gemmatimonadetes bacterium]|nr:aminotransferase class I/II-fold pyridoxal phosphate-dependent enzyme [Gemmatimonadota bacterium]